jgi:hypothetical protein
MKKIMPLKKTPHGANRLIQFQCKDGTMFYYQSAMLNTPTWIIRCPCCGSKVIEATGREYPELDECTDITKGGVR